MLFIDPLQDWTQLLWETADKARKEILSAVSRLRGTMGFFTSKKNVGSALSLFAIAFVLLGTMGGCAGEDYTPVYFPPADDEVQKDPNPSVSDASRQCTMSFTSQICVQIKGQNLEVGTSDGDALCAEVPPFPIHVVGNSVSIKGSEFPDIEVEGHGLPAPITINARGNGDGTSNIAEGTIDASGNMAMEEFSLFIVALGIVGEVPNLTLTTGTTEELEYLPSASGSPPDASGAMTLVIATTLGHVIDAADEYLMGASLIASFHGKVTPALSECGGDGERSIEVKKVVISPDGQQTESALPEDRIMEVSSGTFISDTSADIGPRYEATAKFRVKNVSTKVQTLAIEPRKGPFHLSSATTPLTGTLAPQQSFILDVAFRPAQSDTAPGVAKENISIGSDQFQLAGTALEKGGSGSVSVVDDDGDITIPDVSEVEVGDASMQANAERRFFLCDTLDCAGVPSVTSCKACPDPTASPCELLTVSTEGRPVAEMDAQCQPVDPDAAPMYTIDIKGSADITVYAQKQVLALRNRGVEDLTITSIQLEEVGGSSSTGQFTLPSEHSVFVAQSITEVQQEVAKALAGEDAGGTKLPVTLPPYQPQYNESTAFIVVTYTPDDLLGADGQLAGVGSAVTDRALLKIETNQGDIVADVIGTTTISESPALELYFKTSTGTVQVEDGSAFPFRGVTAKTVDTAVPVFLKTSDTSGNSLRVTSISLTGDDEEHFRWLDTKEEIASVAPPSGKGMRCSIPIVDETTGSMIDESFDLNPVQITASGFDMAPGAYSLSTMPLFGCVDFHRDEGSAVDKRIYETLLEIEAIELAASGLPAANPDGSPKKTVLSAKLLAAIDPLSGRFVLRVTQTMAAILNPKFPGLSAISSRKDLQHKIETGATKITDLQLFTGSMILDPFDEMTITTSDRARDLTVPNDGITGVFRAIDTHPVTAAYDQEGLYDYTSLTFDDTLQTGLKGIFEDYEGVPEGTQVNSWRIYTSTLSYPGPLAPNDRIAHNPSDCITINPCDPEGLKLFTEAGAGDGKGACAFFYASGGLYGSPAFHTAEEMDGGEYASLCNQVDKRQTLFDIDTGRYTVDGQMAFEEVGLRFFGPTYFNNPGSQLGATPPLDAIFHMAFTTGALMPQRDENDSNVLPDTRIDIAGGEYLINLTDTTAKNPAICERNTDNRILDGKTYSTWRYLDGLLFKDPEGTIPAGCPEEGSSYTGGVAYLRGQPLDPVTGNVTFVAGAKFGSSDDLTFAFKDVMMFLVLKGWFCDPTGSEENLEGARCFDVLMNDRDAESQQSITEY
jgi:hypothetical protein